MTEDKKVQAFRIRIREFVTESNAIEGIYREPTTEEVDATIEFLALKTLTVENIEHLVKVYQPEARLREDVGCNVHIGKYYPPSGGPDIRIELDRILYYVNNKVYSAHKVHHLYEHLHPFTDGNGRSGRAIWLRMVTNGDMNRLQLTFLHAWYYESLGYIQERGQERYKKGMRNLYDRI